MADRALAFCNVRSTRSFASVVAGKCVFSMNTCKESAGRSKVFNTNTVPPVLNKQVHKNTSFQPHGNGGSGVSGVKLRDSTSAGKGSIVHHCFPAIVEKPVIGDQGFRIPCSNRLQLLASMESDCIGNQSGVGIESSHVSDLVNHHSFLNDDLAATEATYTVNIPADYSVNKKAAVVKGAGRIGPLPNRPSANRPPKKVGPRQIGPLKSRPSANRPPS